MLMYAARFMAYLWLRTSSLLVLNVISSQTHYRKLWTFCIRIFYFVVAALWSAMSVPVEHIGVVGKILRKNYHPSFSEYFSFGKRPSDEKDWGPSLYYVRMFWPFLNDLPPYVRTFSVHKVRENFQRWIWHKKLILRTQI